MWTWQVEVVRWRLAAALVHSRILQPSCSLVWQAPQGSTVQQGRLQPCQHALHQAGVLLHAPTQPRHHGCDFLQAAAAGSALHCSLHAMLAPEEPRWCLDSSQMVPMLGLQVGAAPLQSVQTHCWTQNGSNSRPVL